MTHSAGSQMDMMIKVIPSSAPQAKAGRIKPLAVSTAKRAPGWPNVQTMAESGLKGFNVSACDAIVVPAGAPAPSLTGSTPPYALLWLTLICELKWQRGARRLHPVCLKSWYNTSVIVDGVPLIEAGFLNALRDAEVRSTAAKFGNPVELLETAV